MSPTMTAASPKNDIPMFLAKLWNLVDDTETDNLIRWSPDGTSFIVSDPARFAKELLPKYFKHRNIASFIRVLNMYEFRKVVKLDSGSLRSNKDDMEFRHPYFVRGNEHLLIMIKRKPSSGHGVHASRVTADPTGLSLAPASVIPELEVTRVLNDVRSLRNNQEGIEAKLEKLKRENETMWAELQELRAKHTHQQLVVNKLIEFFVTLMHNTGNVATTLRAPPPQLAIQSIVPDGNVQPALPPPAKRGRIDVPTMATPVGNGGENNNGPVIRDVTDVWSAYSQQEPAELDWDRLLQSPGQPRTPPANANLQQAIAPVGRTALATAQQQPNPLANSMIIQKVTPDQIAALRNLQLVPASRNVVNPAMATIPTAGQSVVPATNAVGMPPQSTSPLTPANLEQQVDTMQSRLNSIRDRLEDPSYNLDLSQLLNLFSENSAASPSGSQMSNMEPLLALQNGALSHHQDDSLLDGLVDGHDDFLREFENLPSDDLIEGVTIQIPEYPGEALASTIPLSQSAPVPIAPAPIVNKRKRK